MLIMLLKIMGCILLAFIAGIVSLIIIAIVTNDDRGMETVICRDCKRHTCAGCTRFDDFLLTKND